MELQKASEPYRQLQEKKKLLEQRQTELSTQINKAFNATDWRELNLVNYKLEVIENRLTGKFIDPQAEYATVTEYL